MVRTVLVALIFAMSVLSSSAQMPPIEPGVSLELAKWRAERYSDVRYKLNLTLEKMSPVLKGTIEIRVVVGARTLLSASPQSGEVPPIILDWRKISGHEEKSTISNVTINGRRADLRRSADTLVRTGDASSSEVLLAGGTGDADRSVRAPFEEINEHLIFRDGVVAGENVIKLDFTSPILTSGSAITRYVDKEDGSEYIYSLFVPSDASTAFPVFDQPDLKARFTFAVSTPRGWEVVTNTPGMSNLVGGWGRSGNEEWKEFEFADTKPISTYVFAFAAGPFERVTDTGGNLSGSEGVARQTSASGKDTLPNGRVSAFEPPTDIYVRKSQAGKFKPHAAEVFRLNREAVKYFEEYFDYKIPFPKYDLVLIPEFPFGGMEHAGATFLRESSIIFPQEPTRNDHISRALLIFHEASHQWFGDTVTMRWFDDLWLKEGFATFTAYKAMEKIMPEMMAWKVFYERVKQAAYQTDSTKGTTPIYQEIPNLSAAKSAYGNIVYNKAPAFLRQAEFYLGEDKFQTAVRAFLKKHEFANASWSELVEEFANEEAQSASNPEFLDSPQYPAWKQSTIAGTKEWARNWVVRPGLPVVRYESQRLTYRDVIGMSYEGFALTQSSNTDFRWRQRTQAISMVSVESQIPTNSVVGVHVDTQYVLFSDRIEQTRVQTPPDTFFFFPNYRDYGYGIFLLDDQSREHVLKNIQNEKDPFLRSMMWGALWDSVREGELVPSVFVETAIKNLPAEQDETMSASIAGRVGTALNYYVSDKTRETLAPRIENVFSDKMRTAPALGQRITFYRAFLNAASSENARSVLKAMLKGGDPSVNEGSSIADLGLRNADSNPKSKIQNPKSRDTLPNGRVSASAAVPDIPLKTKDKFDIVTRLLILGDPDAAALLAELEKTETSDEAKRYAYAARAGIATAENKAKYWKDFTENKEISESWIEAAFVPWNSIRHSELTLPYLQKALQELPNHKRNRKIFFVNGWLGAFIGGQRTEEALATINKFLADNPKLDNDLRLKILENADIIERAVKIRSNITPK